MSNCSTVITVTAADYNIPGVSSDLEKHGIFQFVILKSGKSWQTTLVFENSGKSWKSSSAVLKF